ncbi:MAG TPA: acylphosphatase [Phycisphaerae bacterium]|nr:acylphosphatase [Phycisphaerae bacterium]
MKTEARRILFSGRVQGIGFRMTAVQFASGRPVSGTVRNLPDGRVEMVVEGESAEIVALVARLSEHFGSFIRNVDHADVAPLPGGGKRSIGLRVID